MNRNNYDFVAPFYNALASVIFVNRINKSQFALLSELKQQTNILYIGGGTGVILDQLLELNSNARITYLEKSKKMIFQTKKKSISHNRINYILGTEDDLKNEKFDAIITNYFLDQFDKRTRERIFDSLTAKLIYNGLWIATDFNPAKKWWQIIIEKLMFLFLKACTNIQSGKIPDIKILFKANVFQLVAKERFYGNYIFSRLYKKL